MKKLVHFYILLVISLASAVSLANGDPNLEMHRSYPTDRAITQGGLNGRPVGCLGNCPQRRTPEVQISEISQDNPRIQNSAISKSDKLKRGQK